MVIKSTQDEESYELDQGIYANDEFRHSSSSFEDDTARAHLLSRDQTAYPVQPSSLQKCLRYLTSLGASRQAQKRDARSRRHRTCLKPSAIRKLSWIVLISLTAFTFITAVFFPSYTNPPPRYSELRRRVKNTNRPGAGNISDQKVFIAASIFDKSGDLAGGHWGENVVKLIHLLGPENVYLSVYENDAGPEAKAALEELQKKVECEHTLRFDDHLSLDEVRHVTLPDGSDRVKRLDYLAEVRNRALQPLDNAFVRYDKLLYLNDVVFDPVDALQLLFSTHADANGHAEYRAACAADFINPIKYYDTFATRDFEGYGIGLPFYPFFTTAGAGTSRKDVLSGSDAVRVRSCWGGMVAFDARYFQSQSNPTNIPFTAASESPSNITAPYRFRAEDDLYWDASECCLIHADIQDTDPEYSGIFLNPYVRVSYDWNTLSWLGFTRRFERLLSPIHWVITKLVGMPWYNPRRAEKPYEEVEERVWVADPASANGGSFEMIKRSATHSGFCGRRALQVLKKDITKGGKNWEFLPVPS